MNASELQGNWNDQKEKLKKKFFVLTDEDLAFDEGKQGEMMERLQLKLGKTKGDLRAIFDSL